MMKHLVPVALVLLMISCQNPASSTGSKSPSNLSSDKITVTVKDWSQDAQGNLTIHYRVRVLVSQPWYYVTVGFWASRPDGYSFAYGTTNNPVPLQDYDGTAYTDYTRGVAVQDVGPYNYAYAENVN